MIDFKMSEKFGLGWKNYDSRRMQTFIGIESLIKQEEIKKQHGNRNFKH